MSTPHTAPTEPRPEPPAYDPAAPLSARLQRARAYLAQIKDDPRASRAEVSEARGVLADLVAEQMRRDNALLDREAEGA